MTIREIYGYALIAGIPIETADYMLPGEIFDMYRIRAKYDARMNGMKRARRQFFE